MRIPRIFTDQPLTEGQEVKLEQKAARHLGSALRLSAGDPLTLFNGIGGEYRAHLVELDSKNISASLDTFSSGIAASPLAVTLAIGLSRGDRFDWIVQKSVELGVARIIPLFTERCEVKLKGERAIKKTRHWQEIARSACEQSGQNLMPEINSPTTLQTALQELAPAGDTAFKVILDPLAEDSLVSQITDHSPPQTITAPESAFVLSGSEGGFSREEIAHAQSRGALPVRLGPRILRTETAPVAVVSLLQAHWGDWA